MPVVYRRSETDKSKVSTIFDHSLVALRAWIEAEWSRRIESPSLVAVWVDNMDSTDRQTGLESGLPEDARAGRFPSVALMPTGIAPRTQGPYHGWAAQRFGIRAGSTEPNGKGRTVFEYVRPIDLGVALRFTCLSQDEQHAFARMWVESAPSVCMDLENKKTGSIIRITFDIDGSTSFAPNTLQADGVTPIRLETSIIVRTFSGMNRSVSNVQQIITKVQAAYNQSDNVVHAENITIEGNNHVTYSYPGDE